MQATDVVISSSSAESLHLNKVATISGGRKSTACTSTSSVSPEIGMVPNIRIVSADVTSMTKQCKLNGMTDNNNSKSLKRHSSTSPNGRETKRQKLIVSDKVRTSPPQQSSSVTLIPLSQLSSSQPGRCAGAESTQTGKYDVTRECNWSFPDINVTGSVGNLVEPIDLLNNPDYCDIGDESVKAKRQSFGQGNRLGDECVKMKRQSVGQGNRRRSCGQKKSCQSVKPSESKEKILSGDYSKEQLVKSHESEGNSGGQVNSSPTEIGINNNKKVVFTSPLLLQKSVGEETFFNKENYFVQKCLDSLVLETRVKKIQNHLASHSSPVRFCLSDDDCESDSSSNNISTQSSKVAHQPELVHLSRLPSAWQKPADSEENVSSKMVAKRVASGITPSKRISTSKVRPSGVSPLKRSSSSKVVPSGVISSKRISTSKLDPGLPKSVISLQSSDNRTPEVSLEPQKCDNQKACSNGSPRSGITTQTLSMTSLHRQ